MKKHFKYTIIIEAQEPSGYFVSVPALPGCFTQGETFEEAFTMIKDAIDGYLSVAESEKIPINFSRSNPIISTIELDRRVRV